MTTRKGILNLMQCWLVASACALSAAASAAPPNASMLANACAGCHGTMGGSAGPSMPSLAGQSKEAIVEAMKKFKSGERPSTIMGRLAKGYSDRDFETIGSFFAAQKLHVTQQTLDPQRVARGAVLHKARCEQCHADDGKNASEDAPVLASQWLPYLQMQIALYLEGQRKMPRDMATKMKGLSLEDQEALLHFYASVK